MKPERAMRELREMFSRAYIWVMEDTSNEPGCNPAIILSVENAPTVLRAIRWKGSLGLAETYMDGLWESDNLQLVCQQLHEEDAYKIVLNWRLLIGLRHFIWTQIRDRIWGIPDPDKVAKTHYDIPAALYDLMLGEKEVLRLYSCALWDRATTLEDAQRRKLDTMIDALALKPGNTVLEVGSGWGHAAAYIALTHRDVMVHGITISEAQFRYAKEKYKHISNLEFFFGDYKEAVFTTEYYDRIYSVGMFEHVGIREYKEFFRRLRRWLKPGGKLYLHTIIRNHGLPSWRNLWGRLRIIRSDPFIHEYIFPHGQIPAVAEIKVASSDYFRFGEGAVEILNGYHYARTLRAWENNISAHSDSIRRILDERFAGLLDVTGFRRMWFFYLESCVAAFATNRLAVARIQMWRKED